MAKLYFKYGVTNSSKSANALMTIHNYEEQGMRVFLVKSIIDTRDGVFVQSRALDTKRKVDLVLNSNSTIISGLDKSVDVIVIDECQFLTESQVSELRFIVDNYNIPVICYGLKTDFQTNLFDASKRLLELADSLSEIKTVCKCGSKAIFNARIDSEGNVITSGEQVKVGGNELYRPMCSKCYFNSTEESI